MRKGFMHVVEIIIIIVVLFFIMMQFTLVPPIYTDFSRTKQALQVNDIVTAMEARGVDWFNGTQVQEEFNTFMPNTTSRISLKLSNVMKPLIKVGVIGDASDLAEANNYFKNFTINERDVEFEIELIGAAPNFPVSKDVIFIGDSVFSSYNINDYRSVMLSYLRNDKGIVTVTDFKGGDFGSVHQDIFGIAYNDTLSTGSNDLVFTKNLKIPYVLQLNTSPSDMLFPIFNNYYDIPFYDDNFNDPASIANWNQHSGTWGIDGDRMEVDCSGGAECFAFTGNAEFENYTVESDIFIPSQGFNGGIGFKLKNLFAPGEGAYFIINTTDNEYYFRFYTSSWENYIDSPQTWNLPNNAWYKIRITAPVNQGGTGQVRYTADIMAANGTLLKSYTTTNYDDMSHRGAVGGGVGLWYNMSDTNGTFDNFRVKPLEGEYFDNILDNTVGDPESTVQVGYPLETRTIIRQLSTGRAGAVINFGMADGRGRTAWISKSVGTGWDVKNLIKSMLIWAAGDEYVVINNDIENPTTLSFFKTINQDTFEIYEVVLSIGKIF